MRQALIVALLFIVGCAVSVAAPKVVGTYTDGKTVAVVLLDEPCPFEQLAPRMRIKPQYQHEFKRAEGDFSYYTATGGVTYKKLVGCWSMPPKDETEGVQGVFLVWQDGDHFVLKWGAFVKPTTV